MRKTIGTLAGWVAVLAAGAAIALAFASVVGRVPGVIGGPVAGRYVLDHAPASVLSSFAWAAGWVSLAGAVLWVILADANTNARAIPVAGAGALVGMAVVAMPASFALIMSWRFGDATVAIVRNQEDELRVLQLAETLALAKSSAVRPALAERPDGRLITPEGHSVEVTEAGLVFNVSAGRECGLAMEAAALAAAMVSDGRAQVRIGGREVAPLTPMTRLPSAEWASVPRTPSECGQAGDVLVVAWQPGEPTNGPHP